MSFSLFERWSPEYALNNAFHDMHESGLDGLKKHLTSNALKTVESIETISGRPEITLITSAIVGSNPVNFLLDKLSECDWTIKDVMKGSEKSKGVVGFKYKENLEGTIDLDMIREDKVWKIDRLASPHFDKVSLS